MADKRTVRIEQVDHIGIRVRDLERALAFYRVLGFELRHKVSHDAVAIIANEAGIEINLIYNANAGDDGTNILMDIPDRKYAGYTHVALRVTFVNDTLAALKENGIAISQGPVTFGDGHVSVFVRDPDHNVIELRGREQDTEGVAFYTPE
jgi:catechol 2,3-dioxygenase-like lactoylglutathione lyase family enzyme